MSEIVEAISALGTATEELKTAKESFEDVRQDADQAISDVNNNFAEKAASLTIVATDGYRKAIEDASGGRNTVIYDDQGNPNIMVVIPRFNCEDINDAVLAKTGIDMQLGTGTHPAFKTNGVDRGEILVGKYFASSGGSGGCSVIGSTPPKLSLDYDASKNLCANKGVGWHMMSVHEWAAIAFLSLANGTIPRGNTNYGRAHDAKWETAIRSDGGLPGDMSGAVMSYAGSGPDTWAHDHGAYGVQDLVGNVWEKLDQMKLEEGQIITTIDNNPSLDESEWHRHHAYFDSTTSLTDGGNVGFPVLSSSVTNRNGPLGDDSHNSYINSSMISSVSKGGDYVENELLRRLLIEFSGNSVVSGAIDVRNYGDRFPRRGGYWGNGSLAGLGALALNDSRTHFSTAVGFRPAYFV